jgi:hypothetical protein
MEKRYLATIKGAGDVGRIILMAEQEHHPDYGTRWHIVGLLPNGTEEDTEVSGAYGGGLASAIESIAIAWGDEIWDLEWLPSADSLELWRDA